MAKGDKILKSTTTIREASKRGDTGTGRTRGNTPDMNALKKGGGRGEKEAGRSRIPYGNERLQIEADKFPYWTTKSTMT